MTYVYTQENRLEHPHRYIYTPFEGIAFLEAFLENRQTFLSRYVDGEESGADSLRDACVGLGWATGARDSLMKFSLDEPVVTEDLLNTIIRAQIEGRVESETKIWLDRLVQRFEVSKKIFVTYLPGFRKGDGAMDDLRLYWQLGTALYLQYEQGAGLKYFSTALKITDLLCSVPCQQLAEKIDSREMAILLQAEFRLVKELIRKKVHDLSV